MSHKIITISREFGSGGKYIGERVAEKLGIPYYDSVIMERIAEETGFVKDFVAQIAEYAPSKSIFSYAFVGRNTAGESIEDYVQKVQRKIIIDLASKGPCVIVGRCADYILSDRHDCLNVFIRGNEEEKKQRLVEFHGVDPEDAEKVMKDTDKKRSINYKYYTGRNWGNYKNYTIMLNSTDIGIEKCIDIIADLYDK